MAFHQGFISPRTTPADPATLLANVRAALSDPTVGISSLDAGHYDADKDSPWLSADIVACQSAIDACPSQTPQSLVKAYLDNLSLVERAIDLTFLDLINTLGNRVTPTLNVTRAQFINLAKNKVDALTP